MDLMATFPGTGILGPRRSGKIPASRPTTLRRFWTMLCHLSRSGIEFYFVRLKHNLLIFLKFT